MNKYTCVVGNSTNTFEFDIIMENKDGFYFISFDGDFSKNVLFIIRHLSASYSGYPILFYTIMDNVIFICYKNVFSCEIQLKERVNNKKYYTINKIVKINIIE